MYAKFPAYDHFAFHAGRGPCTTCDTQRKPRLVDGGYVMSDTRKPIRRFKL